MDRILLFFAPHGPAAGLYIPRQRCRRIRRLWPLSLELRSFRQDQKSRKLCPTGRRGRDISGRRSAQSTGQRGEKKRFKNKFSNLVNWNQNLLWSRGRCLAVRCRRNCRPSSVRTYNAAQRVNLIRIINETILIYIVTPRANILSYWSRLE